MASNDDLANIGYGGMALQVGGALSSMVGSYFAAESQRSALRFQADMQEINSRISESAAQSALNQGQRQIGQLTLQAGQLKSRQRAAMAANGIDLGEGNAAEVQASTDIMKEIDVNQINLNATLAANGLRTQSVNQSNAAILGRGMASGINPGSSAVSSLLSSAGSVASSWYQLAKATG